MFGSCLTLLDGDVSSVGSGDEACLWKRVLEGEQLILGDGLRPSLQDRAGPDGGQVQPLAVPKGDEPSVVFAGEVTILDLKIND
jgi:hypothetical protein